MDQFKDGIIARLIVVGIEGGDASERARLSKALSRPCASSRISSACRTAAPATWRWTAPTFSTTATCSARRGRDTLHGRRPAARHRRHGGRPLGQRRHAAQAAAAGDPTRDPGTAGPVRGQRTAAQHRRRLVTRDGARALLLLQTRAEGSDIDAQARTLETVRNAFAASRIASRHRLLMTGTSVFSVSSRALIESEVHRLAFASLVLVVACCCWSTAPSCCWPEPAAHADRTLAASRR